MFACIKRRLDGRSRRGTSVEHSSCLAIGLKIQTIISTVSLVKNEELSITLDTNYDYYWKRTYLLYEIWGFYN